MTSLRRSRRWCRRMSCGATEMSRRSSGSTPTARTMNPTEAKAALGKLCSEANKVVENARTAQRNNKSLRGERMSWKYNETELWIELANGGRIWFKSADHPDSLFAEDVYAVVIDEATRCKDESWYAIRTTLTFTKAPARIIGNVRGRKNWAYRMARKAEAGAEGFSYAKLTAWDAVEGGILDREEVESAQRDLPDHVFRELYLAEPADDGGNPFGLDAIRACIAPLSTAPITAIGVDLAKSQDWVVVLGLDAQGRTCRLERWQSDWGQTTRRVADTIGKLPAYIDSTGV